MIIDCAGNGLALRALLADFRDKDVVRWRRRVPVRPLGQKSAAATVAFTMTAIPRGRLPEVRELCDAMCARLVPAETHYMWLGSRLCTIDRGALTSRKLGAPVSAKDYYTVQFGLGGALGGALGDDLHSSPRGIDSDWAGGAPDGEPGTPTTRAALLGSGSGGASSGSGYI